MKKALAQISGHCNFIRNADVVTNYG